MTERQWRIEIRPTRLNRETWCWILFGLEGEELCRSRSLEKAAAIKSASRLARVFGAANKPLRVDVVRWP